MVSITHNFLAQLLTRPRFLANAAVSAAELSAAAERVESDPVALQIEVTSRCNFACDYCIVHNGSESLPPRDMSIEMFRRVLDRFPRSFYLQLHGQGEPLLNPRLVEMVQVAEEQRRFCSIVTNGSLWDEPLSAALLEAGVDVIAFSLDLCAESEMLRHRRGMDAAKVVANLERVMRLRDRIRPATAVGISSVLLRHVYEDPDALRAAVDRLDALGIDFLMVGPLAGTQAYRERYPEPLQAEPIGQLLAHRLLPFRTNCTVYDTPDTNFFANRCIWPWAALYVNHDGSVAYCSNNHRVTVGHIDQPELRTLPVFQALRRDFQAGRVPEGCRGCQYLLAYRPDGDVAR